MVTILGTTFGNRLGNSFWLFFCCTSLRRWACRRPRFPFLCRPEKQTTHRGAPIQTQQRAYQTAWRAPLFDLARRDAVINFGVSRSKHFSKAVAIACAPERGASTRWQLKIVQQFVKPRAAGLHPNVQAATDRGVPTRTKRQRARIGRPAQPHVSLGFEVRKRVPETALRHSRMIDVTWAAPLVDRVVGTWARSSAPSTLCATTCISSSWVHKQVPEIMTNFASRV